MPAFPGFIEPLLQDACAPVEKDDPQMAAALYEFSLRAWAGAWEAGLRNRESWDNHSAHEAVVWRNTARIAWATGREWDPSRRCTLSEMKVACLTSFFHDLRPLVRISEERILADTERGVSSEEIRKLTEAKATGRKQHMEGGAQDANRWLEQHPGLATSAERRRCVGYIALHDLCKAGWPYPLSSDFLAVYCYEGDVLWPLDRDFGPLADLQRKGTMNPSRNQLREQAHSNFQAQLVAYRSSSFRALADEFRGGTIIRTPEGARILKELLRHWEIDAPAGL